MRARRRPRLRIVPVLRGARGTCRVSTAATRSCRGGRRPPRWCGGSRPCRAISTTTRCPGSPIRARLEKRAVPDRIASLDPGTGRLGRGPHRPRQAAPLRSRQPPLDRAGAPEISARSPARGRATCDSEVAVAPDGKVIDVRFVRPRRRAPTCCWRSLRRGPSARDSTTAGRRKRAWRLDADGGRPSPPSGGRAPVDLAVDPALRQRQRHHAAPAGDPGRDSPPARSRAEHPARFRLTVDASGSVTDAALQESCGDATLDAAAATAATALAFSAGDAPAPPDTRIPIRSPST